MEEILFQTLNELLRLKGIEIGRIDAPYKNLENFDMSLFGNMFQQFEFSDIQKYLVRNFEKDVLYIYMNPLMTNTILYVKAGSDEKKECIYASSAFLNANADVILKYMEDQNQYELYDLERLEKYYKTLPVANENDLAQEIKIFLQKICKKDCIEIKRVWHQHTTDGTLGLADATELQLEDIKKVNLRYELEEQMSHYVELGDERSCYKVLEHMTELNTEHAHPNSLRTNKSYLAALNTMCRRAAYQAQVEPVYIDRIGIAMANRIDAVVDLSEAYTIFSDIVRKYCLLVRNYSLKEYGDVVRRALIYIDLNLTQQISLKTIADAIGVSEGYLSSKFKKETSEKVTDYIANKRIQYALKYLATTDWPIQVIAEKVGFLDVNYFARLFKNKQGMSASEYRKLLNT